MLKKIILPVVLFASIALTACGAKAAPSPTPQATETPTPIFTPYPCSAENLPAEVAKLHKLTREFDDYSTLASNTPQAQIVQLLPEMQRIVREAEDQQTPACLETLKQLQLNHMEIVVQTLMIFLSASDNAAAEKVNAGISQARELRQQYDVEMARLLGVTLAAPPTFAPGAITPAATATP